MITSSPLIPCCRRSSYSWSRANAAPSAVRAERRNSGRASGDRCRVISKGYSRFLTLALFPERHTGPSTSIVAPNRPYLILVTVYDVAWRGRCPRNPSHEPWSPASSRMNRATSQMRRRLARTPATRPECRGIVRGMPRVMLTARPMTLEVGFGSPVEREEPADMHRILIVDDDLETRTLLSRVLADEGYAVETAPDGRTALKMVTASPPDLLITDLIMPRLSGWSLFARVRRLAPTLPIILISGSDPGFRRQGHRSRSTPPSSANRLRSISCWRLSHDCWPGSGPSATRCLGWMTRNPQEATAEAGVAERRFIMVDAPRVLPAARHAADREAERQIACSLKGTIQPPTMPCAQIWLLNAEQSGSSAAARIVAIVPVPVAGRRVTVTRDGSEVQAKPSSLGSRLCGSLGSWSRTACASSWEVNATQSMSSCVTLGRPADVQGLRVLVGLRQARRRGGFVDATAPYPQRIPHRPRRSGWHRGHVGPRGHDPESAAVALVR